MNTLNKTISSRSIGWSWQQFCRWWRDVKSHSSSMAIHDLKLLRSLNLPLKKNLHDVCLQLQKFLLSSNKPLSTLCAGVVGDLFRDRKIPTECDSRMLIKALMQRSAHTDPMLRLSALKALEMCTKNLSLQRIVSILLKEGVTSANPLVRASTSLMCTWIIDQWGPDAVLALPKPLSEKLMQAMDKLAFDVRPETRTNCRKVVRQLTESKAFHDQFGGSHGKNRFKMSLPNHKKNMKSLMKKL